MWKWRTMRDALPEPLPTPEKLADPVVNPSCSDPDKLAADANLALACTCEAQVNSSILLANTYIQQVYDYNAAVEEYRKYKIASSDYEQCASFGQCSGDYASYQTDYEVNYRDQTKLVNGAYDLCNQRTDSTKNQYCVNDFGSGWSYPGTRTETKGAQCGSKNPPNLGEF